MNKVEIKHYLRLRDNFNDLTRIILGPNYYTINPNVYSSDIEAYEDIKSCIYKIKKELKIYKILFYSISFISIILLILLWRIV